MKERWAVGQDLTLVSLCTKTDPARWDACVQKKYEILICLKAKLLTVVLKKQEGGGRGGAGREQDQEQQLQSNNKEEEE